MFKLILLMILGQSFFDNGDADNPVIYYPDTDAPVPAWVCAEKPIDAVFKITVGRFVGTCIVINTDHYKPVVLTASHMINDLLPNEEINVYKNGKPIRGYIVSRSFDHDMCLIELDTDIPMPCVTVNQVKWRSGESVKSIGLDESGQMITVLKHKILGESPHDNTVSIDCDGPRIKGRSGGGLFNEDDELIGMFTGYLNYEIKSTYSKMDYLQPMIDDVVAGPFPITFYSSKSCKWCKQQHAITENENDRRIIATWSEDAAPQTVLKKLGNRAAFPLVTWETTNDQIGFPGQPQLANIDTLVAMCKTGKAIRQSKGFGRASDNHRNRKEPVGAIQCKSQVDQLFNWWLNYLDKGTEATVAWDRTGLQVFPIIGGDADYSLEALFGRSGHMGFKIKGESKLPIESMGFGYRITGDDVTFDADPITIKLPKQSIIDESEYPKGFVDPLTLWTIVSVVKSIWALAHPTADLYVSGNITATGVLSGDVGEEVLSVKFTQMPTVRIVMLFSFKLGVREVQITREHIKLMFTGSNWITEKTFDIR